MSETHSIRFDSMCILYLRRGAFSSALLSALCSLAGICELSSMLDARCSMLSSDWFASFLIPFLPFSFSFSFTYLRPSPFRILCAHIAHIAHIQSRHRPPFIQICSTRRPFVRLVDYPRFAHIHTFLPHFHTTLHAPSSLCSVSSLSPQFANSPICPFAHSCSPRVCSVHSHTVDSAHLTAASSIGEIRS